MNTYILFRSNPFNLIQSCEIVFNFKYQLSLGYSFNLLYSLSLSLSLSVIIIFIFSNLQIPNVKAG